MKKFIFVFVGFTLVATLVSSIALAAVTSEPGSGSSTSGLNEYGQALEEPAINLEQFNFFNLDFTAFGLTRLFIGVPQLEGTASLPLAQNQPQNYGAFGLLTAATSTIYTQKPVSGVEYFAQMGKDLGFIKPAHAQTTGEKLIGPVTQLWQITRNLAYLAFVIVFVVIGFMVMARTRIDPRTVATVQNAIPGVIVALILVTFSFAIAGLLVDFAQVLSLIFVNALKPVLEPNMEQLGQANIFALLFDLIQPGGTAASNIIKLIIDSIPGAVAAAIGAIAGSGIGQSIIGLFFAFLVIFTAFRVFIMLLTALVTIVLLTIGAPFLFLAGAIPGRGAVVIAWFRNLVSNVLVFPVTFLLLMLAAVFLNFRGQPWNVVAPLPDFQVDLIPFGQYQPPDRPPIPIASILGLGILIMTPRVADMIRGALAIRVPEWAGEPGRALARLPIVGGLFRG